MASKQLIKDLYSIGAIKFGTFTLVSGLKSNYYIDLRFLISYPAILRKVARAFSTLLQHISYDRMCAIPYTGLPLVGAISVVNNDPWMYMRKERKNHGTGNLIEGEYKKGERIVLIDDVIATGGSKTDAIKPLENEGLIVKDIVVLVDREQGGKEDIIAKGYNLHSVYKVSEILEMKDLIEIKTKKTLQVGRV